MPTNIAKVRLQVVRSPVLLIDMMSRWVASNLAYCVFDGDVWDVVTDREDAGGAMAVPGSGSCDTVKVPGMSRETLPMPRGSARISRSISATLMFPASWANSEAEAVGRWFAELREEDRPERCISSPYRRAQQTSEIILRIAR